jgi:hypothetical protein
MTTCPSITFSSIEEATEATAITEAVEDTAGSATIGCGPERGEGGGVFW